MSKIYKNAFGNPEPNVSVDIFGRCTWLNQPGYFSASSVSDFPKMKWEIDEIGKDEMWAVADRIVNRFLEMGFRVSVRQNGYNEPVINAVHIETEKAYKNALAAQKKRESGAEKGFLRFGDIPECGKSYNHRDQFFEQGVSVYNAMFYENGEYEIVYSNDIQLFGSVSYASRPAYRVWGDVVGTGSDGEPLIGIVDKIKKIS